MGNSNTLLAYEMAIEMKYLERALQNQGINYFAGVQFYKTLLKFKGVDEKKWPQSPLIIDNDRNKTMERLEKYFFQLQNLYASEARVKIDDIRMSLKTDVDIPDVFEEKLIQEF